ncbi:MAG: hypothetical protein RR060_01865, partial [Victivallaceae bacterium]
DIEKNQRELREIDRKIKEIRNKLKHLVDCAIEYLENLLKKYGHMFPRRTEIEYLDKIDRQAAALNNVKVGWDRKNGYIGSAVKSDDSVTCNEFDFLLCMERSGKYKVISIPDKFFIGRLYEFRKYDPTQEFGIVYRENKSGKYYAKRSVIDKFIKDREYNLIPDNCRLELFTPRCDAIYDFIPEAGGAKKAFQLNIMEFQLRSAKARGLLIFSKALAKIAFFRYLEGDELSDILVEAAEKNNKSPNEEGDDAENLDIDESNDNDENNNSGESSFEPESSAARDAEVAPKPNLPDDVIESGELPAADSEVGSEDNVAVTAESEPAPDNATQEVEQNASPAVTARVESSAQTLSTGGGENLFGTLLDDIPGDGDNDKRAPKKRKSSKRDKDNDKPEGGDDDTWGIIQPELFGF